ncbi:alpha/beta hydrolase [Fodinicola feengrottensis]
MLLFGPPAAAAPVPRPAPLALDEELPDLAQYGAQSANGGVLRPWPARTVEVDGTPIVVRDTPGRAGSEPALYVHGLGGSSTNWTDLAGLLAPWLDGQALDLPGFGGSGRPPGGDYSQTRFAETVIRWIEQSGRGPVHLFGNSLGGAVSVRVAATRPDLVRTLTLISPAMPPVHLRPLQLRMLPVVAVPSNGRLVARIARTGEPAAIVRETMLRCYADPSVVPEQRVEEAIEALRVRRELPWMGESYIRSFRQLVASYVASYAAIPSQSLWWLARRVVAPTLVVWGRKDQLVDARVALPTTRAIPDSRLMVLGNAGHIAQMECPRQVARATIALLRDAAAADVPAPVAG